MDLMQLVCLFAFLVVVLGLSDVELIDFPLTKGFTLTGAQPGDETGDSVNFAGDVNHDGYADVIIKAKVAGGGMGVSYVIYGHESSFNFSNINLETMVTGPGTGFRIFGGGGGGSTRSVGAAGDVNNDGIADFIVGAPLDSLAYVIYGHDSALGSQGDIHLSTFSTSPTTGFVLSGDFEYTAGFCVSIAGDVNGDYIQDLIATGRDALNFKGVTYIIFGNHTRSEDVHLSLLSVEGNGFQIVGAFDNDGSGFYASDVGDVNGDGIDDFIIGAPFADIDPGTADVNKGTTYVVFGRDINNPSITPFDDMDLGNFVSNATNGYRIIGEGAGSRCGWVVSGVGDVNDDGFADIISVSFGTGIGYVVFGRALSLDTYEDMDLADWSGLHQGRGFRLFGAGPAASGAGDVNGDGFNDILCTTKNSAAVNRAVYVIFGHSRPFDDIVLVNMVANERIGFRIIRALSTDLIGFSVSSAKDFNSDGYDDIMVSSVTANSNAGAVYIVFGEPSAPTSQPSTQPSSQPSVQPSSQPTQPTSQPTIQPSVQPTIQPTCQPTIQPSVQPSRQPTRQPSAQPSLQSSSQPTTQPTMQPSQEPTVQPLALPSGQPSALPSPQPSLQPFALPSGQPSLQPSLQPSMQPSSQPSEPPTVQPTAQPSQKPSCQPTMQPSCQPTIQLSFSPSTQPSSMPSQQPVAAPSGQPTCNPSVQPTRQPTFQPTMQPSGMPTLQPSAQPSRQPSRQPSTQPSRQPTRQPSMQPTGQPTRAPSIPQIITTGEWVYTLNANLTIVDVTSSVDADVWVCGGTQPITCVLVNAVSGLRSSTYTFPWDKFVSVLAAGQAKSIVVSANTVKSGVSYSEIAACEYDTVSLMCSVVELTDTTFVAAINVPYQQQKVHMGQYNALPSIAVVEPSASGGDDTIRSYAYTPSAVRSMKLTQLASVHNFAGVFVAGTGTVLESGATVPVIVAGWVSTSSGALSAIYFTHVVGTIASDRDLVNAIVMVNGGPDSFIAGGLRLKNSAIKNGYLVRVNTLYKTVTFGVKYVSKTNDRIQSVVQGMVAEGSVAYLLLFIAPPATASYIAVLKVNAATGAIQQQATVSVLSANVSCTEIVATTLSLILTCAVQEGFQSEHSAVVLATNRDLSFKKLPAGWMRDNTISFMTLFLPFTATSFPAPTSSKTIPTSSSTYSTLGQTPTWRPTTAPTIQLSSRPTVRPSVQPSGVPSAQPSTSPTSAPSISPQPTSHPSTGGPTNTYKPTVKPTLPPSPSPSLPPTVRPTVKPTSGPTLTPSLQPSVDPSVTPSAIPSVPPTRQPSLRPTRGPTVRPSRFTTVAPSIEGAGSDDAVPLPAESAEGKESDITGAVVIGVAAAGGALGFGLVLLLLCTMCSYKLRKSREKFVKERKAKLAMEAQKALHQRDARVVLHKAVAADKLNTVTRQPDDAIQCALGGASINQSRDESNENVSDNISSIEVSSLHSSERSVTESIRKLAHKAKSARRLSEIEAQREVDSNYDRDQFVQVNKGEVNQFLDYNVDEDSSVEQGFDKLMAEFSDDNSWDSSCSGGRA